MRRPKRITALVAAAAVMLAMAAAAQPAAAAGTVPPFCEAQAEGGGLDRIVSGTAVSIECRLRADERTPHWLVLRTDGDPVEWTLQRRNSEGRVVNNATYNSPEVIVPAGDYTVTLETQTTSVVEVLTRESGLREEVARAQTKVLLSAEVRAAPSGTNVTSPQVGDLTRRISTLADIKTVVVHPFYAAVEAELRKTQASADALMALHDETWEGLAGLERDLELAEQAFQRGQLDRVTELSTMIQRYVAGDAEAAKQIGRLDATRMVALRAAAVVAAFAGIALLIAGGAVYVLLRRHSWSSQGDEIYDAV